MATATTPAEKRAETKIVENYLSALEAQTGKLARGRRTREWLMERASQLNAAIPATSGVKRLTLTQELLDCQHDLESFAQSDNLGDLEEAFIKVAASYSERTGISYAAWREVGVPVGALRAAGLGR